MKSPIIYILTLLFIPILANAQLKKGEIKSLMIKGDNLLWAGKYPDAKDVFTTLHNAYPEDNIYTFRLAICNTHSLTHKKEALQSLIELEADKKQLEDFDYHIATAYYQNYNFEKAKQHFEIYYAHIEKTDNESLKSHTQLLMDYNKNALVICKDTLGKIKLTNLQKPINSEFSEYSPHVTPSEDLMIFTYMGEKSTGGKMNQTMKPDEKYGRYYEDILISYRDSSNLWSNPTSLKGINTKANEAPAGISISGDHLFIFQSNAQNNGDIFESYLDKDNKWSTPTPVIGINSTYWEGSVALSVNEGILYFSSTRIGGYGGSDLYAASLQKDNSWGNIRNLGPEINTIYDEDAPYIHPDNKTLYYSSNGTGSIGGYDVFYADLQEKGNFSNITNAGVPINTLGNDRFYILSADGQTGYFAKESERDQKDQDIYIITPGKIGSPPLLALINGKVFLNNAKENAVIIVRDIKTGEIQGRYKTNPNSDIFTMLLNPGKHYTIDIEIDGVIQYTDTLNSDFIDQFIQLNHDYYVYSDEFVGDKPIIQFSLQEKVQQVYNETTGFKGVDTKLVLQHALITTRKDTLKLHDLNSIVKQNRIDFYTHHKDIAKEDHVTKELLKLAEKTEITDAVEYKKENGYKPEIHSKPNDILATAPKDGKPSPREQFLLNQLFHPSFTSNDLVYRVQVAAYRKPKNYIWSGRKNYGDILEITYPDGITRFTIGGTKHMIEAEELRQKLISFGIEDAFIVAFKGDQRIPLYELIKQ